MPDDPVDLQELIYEVADETRQVLKTMDIDSHDAARSVREVIQTKNPNAPANFPHNWCDFTSCVLGYRLARLLRRGDIDLCQWDADDGTLKAHLWLRIDGLDIDITASQFDMDVAPVIVEQNSEVHRRRFPDPSIKPLLARRPCTDTFERALLKLDLALSAQTKQMDADIIRCRFLRSCHGVSHG